MYVEPVGTPGDVPTPKGAVPTGARVMIGVGTLCIAGVAGIIWWTVVGPVVVIAIITHRVYKIS